MKSLKLHPPNTRTHDAKGITHSYRAYVRRYEATSGRYVCGDSTSLFLQE